MAFDDVTLFEVHVDGTTGWPFGTAETDDSEVDADETVDEDTVDVAVEPEAEAAEAAGGSRGRRMTAVLAVLGVVGATRLLLRRRGAMVPTPSERDAREDAAPDPGEIAH